MAGFMVLSTAGTVVLVLSLMLALCGERIGKITLFWIAVCFASLSLLDVDGAFMFARMIGAVVFLFLAVSWSVKALVAKLFRKRISEKVIVSSGIAG